MMCHLSHDMWVWPTEDVAPTEECRGCKHIKHFGLSWILVVLSLELNGCEAQDHGSEKTKFKDSTLMLAGAAL
eukprot:6492758-Amphidinium_carterae.4